MTTFSIHASGFTQQLRARFALVACTLVANLNVGSVRTTPQIERALAACK